MDNQPDGRKSVWLDKHESFWVTQHFEFNGQNIYKNKDG